MARENVEIVRRALEAIGRADFDATLSLVHPEIVFFPPGDQAPHRGAESFRRWMEPDAFEEQVIEPLGFIDVGGGKVLGRQHIKARGAGSGIELEITTWSVWSFDEDGLITRVEVFLPHEEAKAQKAAGLSE